jgi:hypothetical protein
MADQAEYVSSTTFSLRDLRASRAHMSNGSRGPHQSTRIEFESGPDDANIGSVLCPVIAAARDMRVGCVARRVRSTRRAVFRLSSTASVSDVDVDATIRVVEAHVTLSTWPAIELAYAVEAAQAAASGFCIDIVVQIPSDAADGAAVVLHSVFLAGCNVTLGEAPVRVIVGFNHEPAPAGRVHAAAKANDIPTLTQALNDGCSTEEADGVSEAGFSCPP